MTDTKFESPRLAIRIGVIGNRDLSGINRKVIETQVSGLLRMIKMEVEVVADRVRNTPTPRIYADSPPICYLLNSLGEGADQLAAVAVRDAELGYQFWCPLPFPADEYKEHFQQFDGDSPVETFDSLIASSESVVVEMDCPSANEGRADGYEAAADLLLDNSDLLIAIHDPRHKGSTGGTRETIAKAAQKQIPCIEIDVRQPDSGPRFLVLYSAVAESKGDFDSELRQSIQYILLPPEFESWGRKKNWDQGIRSWIAGLFIPGVTKTDPAEVAQLELERWYCFLNESVLQDSGAGRRLLWSGHIAYAWIWQAFYGGIKWLDQLLPGSGNNERAPKDEVLPDIDCAQRPYRVAQKYVDDSLAVPYMALYRGSFILNFFLGACAVLFALLSYFNQGRELLWSIAECAALIVIFATFISSHLWSWHERAADYRLLAEFLRHGEMLAPLGRVTPLVRPAPHYEGHNPSKTWMGWYLKAFMRGQGPLGFSPTGKPENNARISLNQSYMAKLHGILCEEWLADQYRYHVSLARRYELIKWLMPRVMFALFTITFVAVLIHIAGLLSHHSVDPQAVIAASLPAWREHALLTILVAALPAFLAAVHGISVQGEFERLAERSEATAEHLEKLLEKFKAFAKKEDGNITVAMIDEVSEAARIMLDEVVDWRIIYRSHAVELT